MYTEYFGFNEKPFSIAPNPRYLYMSERHREALAHLLYGMQGEGGIVLLTGEVGTGKTTVCRCMLSQIPDDTDIAFIVNPKLSAMELLATVCDELGIDYGKQGQSIKTLTDRINEQLLGSHARGRHTVLIIDEAQNLDADVLEQLRLLTNLETDEKKLLQIILLGQPELAEKLQQKELRQLSQRITARYHLTALDSGEVRAYVEHRLSVAGSSNTNIFPAPVIATLFRNSGGIPRMINLIADRALLGSYARNVKSVSRAILIQAVREVAGDKRPARQSRLFSWSLALMLLVALAALYLTGSSGENTLPASASLRLETELAAPQAAIPLAGSRQLAFVPLFRAWGIDYRPERDGPACDFAPKHHLECLRQQGGIADMRNLDRPAVLMLASGDTSISYTSVLAMNGSTAELANDQTTEQIELARVALQSRNDFTILWRTPEGYDGPVRPGSKGAIVQLLADKSAAAQNLQWIGSARDEYDFALQEQVKSFQRQQGINPDGVAGPQTWIRMNSLTESNVPTLHRTATAEAGGNTGRAG